MAAAGGAAVGLTKSAGPAGSGEGTDETAAEARTAPPGSDDPTAADVDLRGADAAPASSLGEATDSTRITTPVADEDTETVPRPTSLDEPT